MRRGLLPVLIAVDVLLLCVFLLHIPFRWALLLALAAWGGLALLQSPDRGPAGNPNEALLAAAAEKVAQMRSQAAEMRGSLLAAPVEGICAALERIVAWLQEHPRGLPTAGKLLGLYLDLTLALVAHCARLVAQAGASREVQEARPELCERLESIRRTYEAQYERLVHDEVVAVDTETEVLIRVLELEGLNAESDTWRRAD